MQNTISDIIENFLLEILGDEDLINICRNDLASQFACAPSQINYVLMTRFTVDRGFVIESRRGGGGYITIFKRAKSPERESLMRAIVETDGKLTYIKACHIIDRLHESDVISKREADIIKSAISDKALNVDYEQKQRLRASIFEKIITEILKEKNE